MAKGHKRDIRGKNRLVSTIGSTPVVVRLVELTEEALRIVLVNLLKPRSPKPRRSVEENYLPACLSLTCSRAAGNANTVDRLKGSFSQYTPPFTRMLAGETTQAVRIRYTLQSTGG